MYEITDYTKQKAKQLGVSVKPSTRKGKKIDVFKNNQKISSIGAVAYMDYPTYIKKEGKEYADTRRKLYKARHEKTRKKVNTPSYWADKLLW
jgi:hypothetical protein